MNTQIIAPIMILAIISLTLGMVGVDTTGGAILKSLGMTPDNNYSIENVESSSFWSFFFSSTTGLILTALAGITIAIGVLTRTLTKVPLTIGVITFLVVFVGDFIKIVNTASLYGDIAKWATLLIMLPVMITYLFGLIKWFFEIQ